MKKESTRRRLELRRERLRQLTQLTGDQVKQVVGGGYGDGRIVTRCCPSG